MGHARMTRQLAWAAASDAANRNARKRGEYGRKRWNLDDIEIAAKEFERLWPVALDGYRDPGPQVLQFLEVPTV